MSSPDPSDDKRVLYLEQIDIETNVRRIPRIKLRKDDDDVEIQQKGRTSSWIPSRSLELVGVSTTTISARSKFLPFRKFEVLAEVSGEEAMQAFWDSEKSISLPATFDQQPATITLHFHPSHTSETIRAAVQQLETSMKDYKILMKQSTEQRIDTIIKLGAVIAEMGPFAKLGFGLAKAIFDLLKEQRKYDENIFDLSSGINALLPFADRAVDGVLYEEELLDGVIRRLYDLVGDTANFVTGYAKRGPEMRALRASISLNDHDRIRALHGDFCNLKEEFDRAVNVEALSGVRRIEESDILRRLNPVKAANYEEDHSCMEGTRTVTLSEIIFWAVKPLDGKTQLCDSTSNVFWLYGMPGIGKTSVANSLCDRLRMRGNLGGSFFCKHDHADLREPKRVLPTLIAQLVRMWGPFRKLVAKLLLDEPQINPDSMRGELLLKPLRLLKKHPPRPLVLVIDALDECGQPSARALLLNSLIEACSFVDWLKIVVISRPERDIKSYFDTHQITGRDLATDESARKDIHLFTKSRMALVASQRKFPTDWPGEECVNQIVERSDGLFIFVETLYQLVNVPEPEPLLTQVLGGDSQGASSPLHDLYSTVITSRISKPTQMLHSILRAVVVASVHHPLCDEALADLLGIDPRVVHSWVDELSSLLYRDKSRERGICARHLSILEFLVGSSCPAEFRVDMKLANAELTRCCFRTMANELKFNICGLESSYLSNAEIQDLNDRVQRNIPDALQYSCMHWSNHLCYDLDPIGAEIATLLDDFFAELQPLYWLEVLSLMGEVPVALLALRLIKACFKKLEDHHQGLVEDTLRFVLAFFTPISTSAPHIYISALPFMPMESGVWKRASILFSEGMNVCKGRLKSWPALSGVWEGHTSPVWGVAYSPDGRNVVSGSSDNTIRIWDAQTGVAIGEPLMGHTNAICGVAYSPDGRNIVSGSYDRTVRIWDSRTGAAVGQPLTGHTDQVWCVAYSPDGRNVISGSYDMTVRIWEVQTGAAVGKPLTGHSGVVTSVGYSPNGHNTVSSSYDGTIRIWDSGTGAVVGDPLTGHNSPAWSVAYSPDGRNVVSGYSDQTIRIWDAKTGAAVGEPLIGHTHYVRSVRYSRDGQNIVSSSSDNTVRVWDAQTGEAMGEPLTGHTDQVWCVAYSPDGRNIVSGSSDETIRVWDVETGATVREPLTGHTGPARSVTYSPDSSNVISGYSDQTIQIWDAQTGTVIGEPLTGHTNAICGVAYSPDGGHIVSGSYDGTIRIWDSRTGAAVGQPLTGHTDQVWCVAYSPDGRNVISGSYDMTVRIWEVQTGAAVGKPLTGHSGVVTSVGYSPDGHNAVSSSYDGTIRIWDSRTGAAVGFPLTGHSSRACSVAYSPDGRNIVSGYSDQTIRIWDAKTGAMVGEPLIGHTHYVRGVGYSRDGQNIISGSSDSTVRVWDARTAETMWEALKGHTDQVWCVAYSPNGRNVASGSSDMTVRVWNAQTGAAVGEPLTGHTGPVWSVAYSPDGCNIVSGSSDNTIRIWDAQTNTEEDGRVVVSRNISDNQFSIDALSGWPIPAKLLHSNGWVCSANRLLFWVPEDCRSGLISHAIMTIPNTVRQRCVRIDFTHFKYGASWTKVCGSNPRAES